MSETACRVFDVQRFSIHDGPGIRTTVFLEGCSLRCAWCQNPEAFRHGVAPAMPPEDVIAEVLKDRDYYAVSGGGLTLSGGEPLLHVGPARALLEEAKRHGLDTCVQTAGAVPRGNFAAVIGLVDLFQFDLKHMDSDRHRTLTGAGAERIHENAAFLIEQGARVQFRMPVLPGINDDDANLDRLARFLVERGVHELCVVPYQRMYVGKYEALGLEPTLRSLAPPSPNDLGRVAARMARHDVAVSVD